MTNATATAARTAFPFLPGASRLYRGRHVEVLAVVGGQWQHATVRDVETDEVTRKVPFAELTLA